MDTSFNKLAHLFERGQLAPCWLIYGPREQTRAFANNLTLFILSSPVNGHGMREDLIERHIKNGSFGNYMTLQKNEESNEILIDQLAPLFDFLHKSPLIPGWRVVLIDQVTDLNRFGANSLLKSLEEPPQKTLFLLLCNSLGTLLPTIRSRCQVLSLEEKSKTAPLLLHREESIELLRLAQQGTFNRIQQICDRLIVGDKSKYDLLAITLFDVIYQEAILTKNGQMADLWLMLTRFWEDSKITHLDRQHTFFTMMAGIEKPELVKSCLS
ncbi:MAG: hypothetical protein Q8S21_01475 [Candidatus Paracaedibacteraceae bacterium]|nr:hypothetical protein [Candidatus Paracaedibacteraceae bacterium]